METRHLVLRLTISVVFLYTYSSCSQADVFLDSGVSLKDNTDALVGILSESVVPGGIRTVKINGMDLLVKRFANPSGDHSEFHRVWRQAALKKRNANVAVLSVLKEHDPLHATLTQKGPYRSIQENSSVLFELAEEFSEEQSLALERLVIDAIEKPFTYETGGFRVIASVPIKSIDPDSSLARDSSENGYLFLSEKSHGTTVSKAFWQMQFSETFRVTDLFGNNGIDVQGDEPNIQRYPDSKMTLVFEERANGWHSKSWSYESSGDVLSHVSHYVSALNIAGYSRESNSIVASDHALLQFSSAQSEATLLVELVDRNTQSVQITLQLRKS